MLNELRGLPSQHAEENRMRDLRPPGSGGALSSQLPRATRRLLKLEMPNFSEQLAKSGMM